MNKISALLSSKTEEVTEVTSTSEKSNHDLEKTHAETNLRLITSKSQEFDPVTSNLAKDIIEDDYAAVKIEDDSPYPEVRAAIPSDDDPSILQNTVRMWVLTMVLGTVGAGVNILFSFHSPQFSLSSFVTTLLAWPLGNYWGKYFPNWKLFGLQLNPGPFTIKEHALICIGANVGLSPAYATDILLAQNRFYGSDFGWGFDLLATMSTQCIGFAFGGLCRRILVDPPSMIWPSNLVTATFLTNLHINENHPANGWKISRLAFFSVMFICSFVYYWFPGYIFQALSYFSWITWIKPNNVIINQIFGSSTGLGMFPNNIALDWNQIAGYIGSPLIPPAGTIWTIFFSVVVMFWIVTPALHYSNTWFAQYLPISSSGSYDRYQQPYNVSRIVDPKTLTFNKEEYANYSPLFLSTTFALSYGLSFAAITATIVHTVLFHGRDIVKQFKRQDTPDVHNRLMKSYKPTPDWWFAVVFVIFFGMAVGTLRGWPTEMPIWALVVGLIIGFVFLLPVGVIYALTNIAVGLNVVSEFIIGYMIPGKPLCMMFFKTFTYITNSQAVTFAQDMKLGHYMKLQPRLMFWVQMIPTVWTSIVQIAVLRWSYGNINDLCLVHQPNHYTCPNGRVFFNASIIWGVIGPQRQFSSGQIYYGLLFFFIIGAILPVISWLILKKWPGSPIRWLNWPVFFSGTGYIPPATPYNYTSYCAVGLTFGYFIKRKFFHWWTKYNYSLSAGLDIGLAWSSLVIFCAISLPNVAAPNWWGNNVINTLDYNNEAIKVVLPEGGSFGPSSW